MYANGTLISHTYGSHGNIYNVATHASDIDDLMYEMNVTNIDTHFNFFRRDNGLYFEVPENTFDAEDSDLIQFPTIKVQERGKINRFSEATNLMIPLQNIRSNLELIYDPDYQTEWVTGNKEVSKWGRHNIMIDISGVDDSGAKVQPYLDPKEIFTVSLISDKYKSDKNNNQYTLPTSCANNVKASLEYKKDGMWHSTVGIEFTDKNSEFRIKLPNQLKLVDYEESNIERMFQVELKYVNSAMRSQDDPNVRKPSGYQTSGEGIRHFQVEIKNDSYNPEIAVKSITYNGGTPPVAVKVATADKTSHLDLSKKIVGPAVENTPNASQTCVPNYAQQHVYDIAENMFQHLDGEVSNSRHFDIFDIESKENFSGSSQPIAGIEITNFRNSKGNWGVQAEIVGLFRKESDEIEYDSTGKFCLQNSDSHIDRDLIGAPDLIPANTNYEVIINSAGNEFHLYRKSNIDYEAWIGGSQPFKYADGTPYREIVVVRVKWSDPSNDKAIKSAHLLFTVEPKDVKEITYSENFDFTINEGETEKDISTVLSATIQSSEDGIEYHIAGYIDESGNKHMLDENQIYSDSGLGTKDKSLNDMETDLALKVNDKSLTATNGFKLELADHTHTDGTTGATTTHNALVISREGNAQFNAYQRDLYQFIVQADVTANEKHSTPESNVESAYSLVTIQVIRTDSKFSLDMTKSYETTRVETLGTTAEGKTQDQNNPNIPIKQFVDNRLSHSDANLAQLPGLAYCLNSIDANMQLVKKATDGTFNPYSGDIEHSELSSYYVRLNPELAANKSAENKDTVANNTTPGQTEMAHYNYERQNKYEISLEAKVRSATEITSSFGYVNTAGETTTVIKIEQKTGNDRILADTNKSADVHINYTLEDLRTNSNSNMDARWKDSFYYRNADNSYAGPLTLNPKSFVELTETIEIDGNTYSHAWARTSDGHPLYQADNFQSRAEKPPQPIDSQIIPFDVKVIDSFDTPKVSPQPYRLQGKKSYKTTDPSASASNILANSDINVEYSAFSESKSVCYVFTDHGELNMNNGKDVPASFVAPSWSTNPGVAISQNVRQIHPECGLHQTNTSYNNGLYNGDENGKANGSFRYGKFDQDKSSDIAILDFFVESHSSIDGSGFNEIGVVDDAQEIFGERLTEYSSTSKIYNKVEDSMKEVKESDKRIFRLNDVCRSRKHTGGLHNPYFASAELNMNMKNVEAGHTYSFTVVAVSNAIATENDMSLNKNMCDWNETFYQKLSSGAPQPFQKYCYDLSGERIVTAAFAREEAGNSCHANAKDNVLLCCRTHFTVCVNDPNTGTTTISAQSGSWQASTTINAQDNELQFGAGLNEGTLNNDGSINTKSIGTNGQIALFNIDNDSVLARYDGYHWYKM